MSGERDDPRREALRRRLYRPEASDADVAAFEASAPAPPAPAGSPPPPLRPRRSAALLGAGALAAGVLAAAAIGAQAVRPQPAATRTAAPSPVETAATSTPERIAFIRALTQDGEAGVASWLDQHWRNPPGVLAQARRSDTLEFEGDGTRRVPLDPPSIGDDGGHVTVLVVAAVDARVTWTLLGAGPDPAWGSVRGTGSAVQRAGELTATATAYRPGGRPASLLVVAPDGVRWGVAAVFSE